MKRPPLPLLILLLALLVAAAFLALDFWAARSNTSASSQVATIRSGEGYNERPTLAVYVEAPENLSRCESSWWKIWLPGRLSRPCARSMNRLRPG
jgi:hypothetical protein